MLMRTEALCGLFGIAVAVASAGCSVGPDGRQILNSSAPPATREYHTLAAQEEATPSTPEAPPVAPSQGAEAPPTAAPTPPAEPVAPTPSPDVLQQLYRKASQTYAGMDSYIVRLKRREQVAGKDCPPETLMFTFRKKPYSVHFRFLDGESKGREVVYVKDQHEDKIHTLTAAGDVPFMGPGQRISLAPDSALVRARSRYPITEAGIGSLIDHFGQALAYKDRNGNGVLRYLGPQKRADYDRPLQCVEQMIPAGKEEATPQGGRRLWYFDPASGLPVLVVSKDTNGKEVEYYCYDRFEYPVKLDDADFDPEQLWKTKSSALPH